MRFIHFHAGFLWTLLARKETKQIRKRGLDCPVESEENTWLVVRALTQERTSAADTFGRKLLDHLSDRAILGSLLLFGGGSSCSREELKCGTLTTSTRHMRSWEDERSRAGPAMRRLCWWDLIVAKDIMSHLHRHNEQELKVFKSKSRKVTNLRLDSKKGSKSRKKSSSRGEFSLYDTRLRFCDQNLLSGPNNSRRVMDWN